MIVIMHEDACSVGSLSLSKADMHSRNNKVRQ